MAGVRTETLAQALTALLILECSFEMKIVEIKKRGYQE
jgi:hypothetical protein